MKKIGKIIGWTIFVYDVLALYSVYVYFTNVSMKDVIDINYGFDATNIILTLGIFAAGYIVIWILSLFIKVRKYKFILYILLSITGIMGIFGSIAGILLAVNMNKEMKIEIFKEMNGIYPWEVDLSDKTPIKTRIMFENEKK